MVAPFYNIMSPQELVTNLHKNPYVLSPMAGITDSPLRSFMKEMGVGIVVSEFISATGLEHKSPRSLRIMSYTEIQRPVGLQIFGVDPSHMANAAQFLEEKGADFIDINFGCPAPKVTRRGAGSGALKDLPHLTKVINSVVKAVKVPVTIKVRTGWDEENKNAHETAKIAYNEGVTWMAIHGRTRSQGYSGRSDWDYISEIKTKSAIPILGNGDVITAKDAISKLKSTGVDGILIGRGALKNPYIFKEILNEGAPVRKDFAELLKRLKSHYESFYDERITGLQLKKFAAWFATGYPNCSQFRKRLFTQTELDAVIDTALEYLSSIASQENPDTSSIEFLMGGHG